MKQVFLGEVAAGVIERGDMAFALCCDSMLFQNCDGIQAEDDNDVGPVDPDRHVRRGLFEMMAIFSPKRQFRSVDLPTFGLPMMEMKPDLKSSLSIMVGRIPEISAPRNRKAAEGNTH